MSLLLALAITLTPMNDLGPRDYAYGFIGGLWADGTNTIPADHLAAGMRMAARIQPLDVNGHPSPDGKVGVLGIGSGNSGRTFEEAASLLEGHLNQSVVMVNAASDQYDATQWAFDWQPVYGYVNSAVLPAAGVSPLQVQAAWMQLATDYPATSLPIQDADMYRLKGSIAEAMRALKTQYPNLQVIYLSSNVYAGWATTARNPEPYAYESALSVRLVLLGQIELARTGFLWDTRIGDVDYAKGSTPWATWGPYLWASDTPRSDGFVWTRDDFAADGETLSEQGAQKAGMKLAAFFLTEPTTAGWMRKPGRGRVVRH